MEKKFAKLLEVYFVELFEKKENAENGKNNDIDIDCDYDDDNMIIDDDNYDYENGIFQCLTRKLLIKN